MDSKLRSKLHSESGVSWLIAVLLVAVLVLSITAMIPTYRRYQEQGSSPRWQKISTRTNPWG